jgi:hypothetical protein
MCAGCLSAGAALVVQGSAVMALAQGTVRRLRDYREGRDAMTRLCAAYQANAEFIASLGLDPGRVLGPPPTGYGAVPEMTQATHPVDRVSARDSR